MRLLQDKYITLPWQVKCAIFSAVYFKEFYNWIDDQVFTEVEWRVQDLRLRVRDHVWDRIDA